MSFVTKLDVKSLVTRLHKEHDCCLKTFFELMRIWKNIDSVHQNKDKKCIKKQQVLFVLNVVSKILLFPLIAGLTESMQKCMAIKTNWYVINLFFSFCGRAADLKAGNKQDFCITFACVVFINPRSSWMVCACCSVN